MKNKPEALRLAELLDNNFDPYWVAENGYDRIAAELRRQHAEIKKLRDALEDIKKQPEGDEESAQAVAREALKETK